MEKMNRRLCYGVLASLCLHAVAAAYWWVQRPGQGIPFLRGAQLRAIEVRIADRAISSNVERVAPAEVQPPTEAPPEVAAETVTPPTASQAMDSAGHPAVPSVPDFGLATTAPLQASTTENPNFQTQEPPYIPAGELDVRPQPEAPVIVPFPDAPLDKPKVAGVLILFIGESGQVERIEVAESDLPPAFEQAAIGTFMQARMQPGIKDGLAVRARMKILVEFEAR